MRRSGVRWGLDGESRAPYGLAGVAQNTWRHGLDRILLGVAMDEVGATWDDIVRRTIYTLQPTEYETITRAIDSVTGGADHPAQTIVGVTGLAVPGLLIEIECTAVLPG